MGRTFLRQITQIRTSDTFDDTIVPSLANFETNPTEIETDLNTLRSRTNDFLNRNDSVFTGNWYDSISAPSTFENGIARGINLLNQDLHDLQRKRVLDRVSIIGNDISVASANDQFVILALSELPGNTTIAVGAVTTLGTVAAFEASFGTATLTEVTGPNALRPKNLAVLWNASGDNIGDVVDDADGTQIFGLLQSESSSDGFTATGTTPVRLQMSFVKTNGTGDDLILVTAGEMSGVVFDYAPVERFAFGDLPEDAFLGTDFVDSGVANTTRDAAYVSQGTTPVDLLTNATLDLEGAGLSWQIRDDLEVALLAITEGSAGGTSTILFGAAVDTFDNDAISNNFANGVSLATGSGNTIGIGLSSGLFSAVSDLSLRATTGEMRFDDGNRSGSTFSAAVKLTETTAEWDDYETAFGEVSLFNAITQANGAGSTNRADVYANQGTTAAEITTNAILDLNVAGIQWEIRDLINQNLFRIKEGSTGGTNLVLIGAATDDFVCSATNNTFSNGVTINGILVSETAGTISRAGDLTFDATGGEILFDDTYRASSSYSQNLRLADSAAEWTAFDTVFGEISILNSIVAANTNALHTRVQATVTVAAGADANVNGPVSANNLDVNLPAYDNVTFVTDVDVYLNGVMLRNNASSGAEDVYPGTTPSDGDLKFTFALVAGGTPDQITVIVRGQ